MFTAILREINSFDLFRELIEIAVAPEYKKEEYEAKVEGINEGGKTGTSPGEGGGTNHGWFAGYFEYNGQKYTLVVVAPNIGETHPDGRELGGGNTGAPIFRDIVNSLIK